MTDRTVIEELLTDVARRREEAEAEASHAADSLVRIAGGLTPLTEQDPDRIRAAADDYAGAVERLKLLTGFARDLRSLLM